MIRFEPQHYLKIAEFIFNFSGIVLERLQLNGLGDKIIAETQKFNVSSFEDYLFLLKNPAGDHARDSLINQIAVSESFFFRNPSQFRYLARDLFPELYRKKKSAGLDQITIWSAGCSTGEETYSIAYIAFWFLNTHPDISFSISGTDINAHSLEKCRIGNYRSRSLRSHVNDIRREFILPLVRETTDGFVIEERLRRMAEFRFTNLRDLGSLKSRHGSDIIFCRNVLIYFDEPFRTELTTLFHQLLQPGGMLFLGETESLPAKQQLFELVQCRGAYGYRKPLTR
ncbi:MAG: protein-glutamate O-methyltransferase CheR [Candidatus Ozemobacteraceae bacterium]